MQIYRRMDIGTAKATPDEQSQVRHHLLDFLSPDTPYSAADYAIDAYNAAKDIQERGKLPLFCGGTGLYLEAARTGRHAESPSSDEKYRAYLQDIAQKENGKNDAAQYRKVLSSKKVAKLYIAEESYRRHQINRMKPQQGLKGPHGEGQGPKPQANK